MCGDLDDEEVDGARQLYAAFLQAAQATIHDIVDHRGGARDRLTDPLADRDLHAYMDGLFADVLRACLQDSRRVDEGNGYRVLASQAVVLARLAGFLAGRLDPAADPLRNAIEALMSGYTAPDHDHEHHH